MLKEIIVNAGEMESRVAILEDGRLMELHIERDQKIVGNIYKGRVTKVLKGMDAAFVDIGIEKNAFLAVSDIVSEDDDEGGGRFKRFGMPSITTLLKANQEILVQVMRAPMGTKGARVTTRLSLPGRYMVLMLNGGGHSGVSRKIEDPHERQRLRAIAANLKPGNYSLIVRTEAEGRTEEELKADMDFLVEMADRITAKAAVTKNPNLIHGDLTLISRLIRDSFTRDINRLVIDSESAFENTLELVGMIAPGMKERVFLYDEKMPIFHAYNIEPEVEKMLRRKVWLPSGGHLVIDQAEALTAIDVNTGKFIGSVELAETVLTTNLQAAHEVARQLRLRDLGGIIVVDFIDMDNPRHRQQVITAFSDALKKDRAKIKFHNISSLGLVEMTRKRTGESMHSLLTEPCPCCSGIGRVQNALTMALRVDRDIAALHATHPDAEAYLVRAHSRVIADMLGYEGEAHRDLEAYIGKSIYLRFDDDFHPNAYEINRVTMEQALLAVPALEDGDVVEIQVINPIPDVSMDQIGIANGIFVIVPDLDAPVGSRVKVKITDVGTSIALAEPLAKEQKVFGRAPILNVEPSTFYSLSKLPPYLREEQASTPPREWPVLSPTAVEVPEDITADTPPTPIATYRTPRNASPQAASQPFVPAAAPVPVEPVVVEKDADKKKKRKRKRKGKGGQDEAIIADDAIVTEIIESVVIDEEDIPMEMGDDDNDIPMQDEPVSKSRNKRRRKKRKASAITTETLPTAYSNTDEQLPEDTDFVIYNSTDDIINLLIHSELNVVGASLPEAVKTFAELTTEVVAPTVVESVAVPVAVPISELTASLIPDAEEEPLSLRRRPKVRKRNPNVGGSNEPQHKAETADELQEIGMPELTVDEAMDIFRAAETAEIAENSKSVEMPKIEPETVVAAEPAPVVEPKAAAKPKKKTPAKKPAAKPKPAPKVEELPITVEEKPEVIELPLIAAAPMVVEPFPAAAAPKVEETPAPKPKTPAKPRPSRAKPKPAPAEAVVKKTPVAAPVVEEVMPEAIPAKPKYVRPSRAKKKE
ncbi:MAG: Rne/Rng family ribonuclease [bacterium]